MRARVSRSLFAVAAILLGTSPVAAQMVPRPDALKPGALRPPRDLPALPGCKLVIHDVVGRVPLKEKRPYFDIVVRNIGEAPCGTPPPNGYNYIFIAEYFVQTSYKMPIKGAPAGHHTRLDMQAHEAGRHVPDFSQSLKQLDELKPGQITTITIATPNGYCAKPDPECVPYKADFIIRVDVRYWVNGKAVKAPDFYRAWSIAI